MGVPVYERCAAEGGACRDHGIDKRDGLPAQRGQLERPNGGSRVDRDDTIGQGRIRNTRNPGLVQAASCRKKPPCELGDADGRDEDFVRLVDEKILDTVSARLLEKMDEKGGSIQQQGHRRSSSSRSLIRSATAARPVPRSFPCPKSRRACSARSGMTFTRSSFGPFPRFPSSFHPGRMPIDLEIETGMDVMFFVVTVDSMNSVRSWNARRSSVALR